MEPNEKTVTITQDRYEEMQDNESCFFVLLNGLRKAAKYNSIFDRLSFDDEILDAIFCAVAPANYENALRDLKKQMEVE